MYLRDCTELTARNELPSLDERLDAFVVATWRLSALPEFVLTNVRTAYPFTLLRMSATPGLSGMMHSHSFLPPVTRLRAP